MIGNKIADRITKSTRKKAQKEDDRIMGETQEIIIPPEKREHIIKESEQLSKFVTREYVRVNSLSNTYNENKSIRFKTPMLMSNLCDYSDAYILFKGKITVTAPGANNGVNNIRDKRNRPVILKNNAPFVSCITRINGELIEDADDLDIVMPMYDLSEYSKNYRKTIGSIEKNYGTQEIELAIPLKYLGNFWRALNIPLISCEVFLELKWNKNCVITSLEQRQVDAGPPVVRDNAPTGATLSITDCKLYIPVVTLSKDDEIKLLTNLKSGFKSQII